MSAPQPIVLRGIVKQIQSGDAVVVRGQPKGGPPLEKTICLSNVTAPRLARRANPNLKESVETKDEPWAWEAREFMRKKLIGKEVSFTIEYSPPGTSSREFGTASREYGCIYAGKDTTCENMTESMVAEGLVEVRRGGLKLNDENQQRLCELEDAAKAAGKGRWGPDPQAHVRDVIWNLENPRHFVDSHHQKPVDAIIEHVRDGCTVRAFLLPTNHHVTIMMSGIKCPMFKLEDTKQVPEPFAVECKYFTESRLLHREVKVILEGVSNQNILGTIIHPKGNIAELLLREGFAKCVDWSMGVVTQGADKLRAAEKAAKDEKKRLWIDYKPSTTATMDIKDKNFTGKVVEVVNGDSLVVKQGDKYRKIFLASLRPPRPVQQEETEEKKPVSKARTRPLYDIPYMLEAREFLRKKLINKKVNIQIDYIQPPAQGYPEKTCCTVTINDINVAEALISKGLATVIRYRQDDDQRSAHYDELLAAEERAKKKAVGLHSKKEPPIHRVADVSGDATKAKQFLPFLQRAGRSEAIVEFVASGSRVRVFIPRDTCLITILLSGIECPRGPRPVPGGQGGIIPGDAYGEEALQLTKEMCLQREVEVEVEATDKGGNFIGWLYVDGVNMSVALVEAGLSKMHFTAERTNYYRALQVAEEQAKTKKKNIWKDFKESVEVEVKEEPTERKVNYQNVVVTEVTEDLHFFAQSVDNGPQVEKMMEQLRQELSDNPPLPGSYIPKKGDLCAAKFTDGEWYRAKVTKVEGQNKVHVLYIDFGNREITGSASLAVLPPTFHSLPAQAQEYSLACVSVPEDGEAKNDAIDALYNDILNKTLQLNIEYRGTPDAVSLQYADSQEDVAKSLIAEGLLILEARREKRFAKMVSDYRKAQDKAKAERLNLWRYGDFREDEAAEFGYKKTT
ncbi:unnamed protein product [Owenia fusiformis]|uniref:Staphylococcal nuclease domain-containing protein 1 n=1 Tax=Owenia fusiformis TaxID=6347 RepID=A0A8J1TBQ0_OWEFU|nr:unnamed protein product [Owenia fusiformis]